jgi:hypothetical protein
MTKTKKTALQITRAWLLLSVRAKGSSMDLPGISITNFNCRWGQK